MGELVGQKWPDNYARVVKQIEDTHFLIKHLTDSRHDINVWMIDDVEGRAIEWDGLPMALITSIEKDYETLLEFPLICLQMAIQEEKESKEGLRPLEEKKKNIDECIELKEVNPSDYYERE